MNDVRWHNVYRCERMQLALLRGAMCRESINCISLHNNNRFGHRIVKRIINKVTSARDNEKCMARLKHFLGNKLLRVFVLWNIVCMLPNFKVPTYWFDIFLLFLNVLKFIGLTVTKPVSRLSIEMICQCHLRISDGVLWRRALSLRI